MIKKYFLLFGLLIVLGSPSKSFALPVDESASIGQPVSPDVFTHCEETIVGWKTVINWGHPQLVPIWGWVCGNGY